MSLCGTTIESRTHIVGGCEIYNEERDASEEMRKLDVGDFFFFLDPPGDPGKKRVSSIHTLSLVYQLLSICKTQSWC